MDQGHYFPSYFEHVNPEFTKLITQSLEETNVTLTASQRLSLSRVAVTALMT